MIKTMVLYWLISIAVWPVVFKLAMVLLESLNKISTMPAAEIRKLGYDIGVGLLTSGFLGALLGINFSSEHFEIIARLILSVTFVILGFNLIAKYGSRT